MVIKAEKIEKTQDQILTRISRLLEKKQALEYLKESTSNVDKDLLKLKNKYKVK